MIEIKNLSKSYGAAEKKVLDDINLDIGPGMFGVLGIDGAGKSTLMNILAAVLPMTSGEVKIQGILLAEENYREIRKIIGYMPQESGAYPDLTVKEIAHYYCSVNQIKNEKETVEKAIRFTGLEDAYHKKFKFLPSGMKRRFALAVALFNNPDIVIVDEPAAGVGAVEKKKIRELLLELSKEKAVLMATSNLEDISATCTKLAFLDKGKIIYNGNLKNMVDSINGKVFLTKTSDDSQTEGVKAAYEILGMRQLEDGWEIRFYSPEKPEIDAESIDPTFEDAYLAWGRGLMNDKIHLKSIEDEILR